MKKCFQPVILISSKLPTLQVGLGRVALNVILVVTMIVGSGMALAQEDSKPDTSSPSVAELMKQWSELDQQLLELETSIAKSDQPSEDLRKQLTQKVMEARELVEQIEAVAKAELETDRTAQQATRALMGIMLDAASKDQDAKVLRLGDFLIGKGINPEYFKIAAKSERLAISQKEIFDELLLRQKEAMANDLPRVKLSTTEGDIVLELFENEAPGTVGNFINLAESGYFDGVLFHRVMEDFIAQTGGIRLDDQGKEVGEEGPGYNIKDECQRPDCRLHFTYSLSMANRNMPNTGGSQFFITFKRTDFLDKKHTVFGRVVEGFDVLGNLERTASLDNFGREIAFENVSKDKINKVTVLRKRDHEYVPVKVGDKPETDDAESSNLELNSPESGDGAGDNESDSDG